MSQRRCGTCRYFEEGALAGSGWCRHPQRRDLQHMVLVRKSELACRTGWDEDLWDPRNPERERPHLSLVAGEDMVATETPAVPVKRWREPTSPAPPLATTAEPAQETKQPGARPRREMVRKGGAQPLASGGVAAVHSTADSPQSAESKRSVLAAPATRDQQARSRAESATRSGYASTERPHKTGHVESKGIGSHDPAVSAEQLEPASRTTMHGWQQRGATEPFYLPEAPTSVQQDEPADMREGWQGMREEPLIQAPGTDLPAIPQCCRTCRDFRPNGDGSQGWCGNPYAFPERTRVSADDLACYSSLGSWWLPSDDWWLQQADISHHGMPTPNVDEYLRQLQAEQEASRRRRVGS